MAEVLCSYHHPQPDSKSRASDNDVLTTDSRLIPRLFRSLAPECPPIHIQRWSARRATTTAALFSGGALFACLLFDNLNDSNFF